MSKDYTTIASNNGQRYGQFLWNALCNYLEVEQRRADDQDVSNALFYFSNEDIERVLGSYERILEARKPLGFMKGEK